MKHKPAELIAFLIFACSIGYILGQAGLSDTGDIDIGTCMKRVAVALVILGLDAVLVGYLGWKDEQQS